MLASLRPRLRRPGLRLTAAVLGAVLVAAVVVIGLTKVQVRTDLDTFLPRQDPVAAEYQRLTESFGGDPVVVLIESGSDQSLLAPDPLAAVVRLEGRLAHTDDVAAVYGPGTLLNQVAGRAQDLLAELFGRRDAEVAQARVTAKAEGRSPEAAADAVRSRFDLRYGPLLVQGLPSGVPTLGNEKFVRQVVLDSDGNPRGQWKLLVPTGHSLAVLVRPRENLNANQVSTLVARVRAEVAGAGLDAAVAKAATADGSSGGGAKAGAKATGVTVKVAGASVLVAALSDRAVHDVPVLGGLAVAAVGGCFLFATWIRRSRRLLPVATTLVSILATVSVLGWWDRPVTVAVIAFLSVLLGIGCYYPTYLAMRASGRTLATVVLASACSLGTLALSPLPLVRDLGLVLALGVVFAGLAAVACRRLLVGSLVVDAGPRAAGARAAGAFGTVRPGGASLASRRGPAIAVLVAMAVAAVLGWARFAHLPLTTDVDAFANGLPELAEARHVETVLGSSGEVSVVLGSSDVLRPAGLAWMSRTLDEIVADHGDRLRPILSPPAMLGFLGSKPTADQIDAAYRLLPSYLTGASVTPDRSIGVMTFGVDLDDLAGLRATLAEVQRGIPAPPAGYQTRMTGLPLVFLRAEKLVSDDRYAANLLGIGAAGLVLLIGLRRRSDALRGVLSAVLATGTGFALVALTGIGLNPITGALGALTAAVGCEFTVMLAEAARGRNTLRRAVLLVAATSAAGYLVLLASGLDVVRSFGLFLASGVGLALVSSWAVVTATVTGAAVPPLTSGAPGPGSPGSQAPASPAGPEAAVADRTENGVLV